MVGRTFLEWNSTAGVLKAAWYIMATAKAFCNAGCRKVRLFDSDCAHRDILGEPKCKVVDISDDDGAGDDSNKENVPVLDKGKSRAL